MRRLLKLNENGSIIGESHPRAILTNHEVSHMLRMHVHGQRGSGYKALAKMPDSDG